MSGKRWTTGWLLLLGGLMALGCGKEPSPPPAPSPERIVVMSASAAEILDSLDLLDRVVGVGDFVQWPPELAGLPRLGAYDTPSPEQVLALRTDLLIVTGSKAGKASYERLRSLGVEVMELKTNTYEAVLASLRQVGERLGRAERAREVEREIRSRMDGIRLRAEGAAKPRVLFVVGQNPLYVAGPGSHADEMVRAAGGVNVASDALSPYQLVSLEAMLDRQPDVIIDSSDNRPGALRGRQLGPWGRWTFLPAVRQRRVYHVDPVRLSIPSPRLPEMTELVGKMIHPEIFGEATGEELGPLGSPISPVPREAGR
jgi:iron complex transport system substrate-binding protein